MHSIISRTSLVNLWPLDSLFDTIAGSLYLCCRYLLTGAKTAVIATGIPMIAHEWSEHKEDNHFKRSFEAKMILMFVFFWIGSSLVGRARWVMFSIFRRDKNLWLPFQVLLGLAIVLCGEC